MDIAFQILMYLVVMILSWQMSKDVPIVARMVSFHARDASIFTIVPIDAKRLIGIVSTNPNALEV